MGKKLAIKGHSTRGEEVIKLLEMMGGTNPFSVNNGTIVGNKATNCYHIAENTATRYISWGLRPEEINTYKIFTLEEFLEKYPFKVGDKVIDRYGEAFTIDAMSWSDDCETMVYTFEESNIVLAAADLSKLNTEFKEHDIVTVVSKDRYCRWICEYKSREADELLYYKGTYVITDNGCEKEDLMYNSSYDIAHTDTVRLATPGEVILFERLIRKNKMPGVLAELLAHIKTTSKEDIEKEFEELKEWSNVGPTVEEFRAFCECVNRKPKYPTTYEECCQYLGCADKLGVGNLIPLQQLVNARNAYWKIAGEEMGLDKRWEPDWSKSDPKYTIVVIENRLVKHLALTQNFILAFPTEEMRDVFYKNFKSLIESCKELL